MAPPLPACLSACPQNCLCAVLLVLSLHTRPCQRAPVQSRTRLPPPPTLPLHGIRICFSWRDEWPEEMRKAAAPRMADLLHMSDALNPASSIDAASWVPQLVVMAAGTNDFHNWSLSGDHHVVPSAWAPPTLQEWADGFEALIQQIRKTYPEAAIVVMASAEAGRWQGRACGGESGRCMEAHWLGRCRGLYRRRWPPAPCM